MSLRLIQRHVMKALGGMEVQLHALTSELDGGSGQIHALTTLSPGK